MDPFFRQVTIAAFLLAGTGLAPAAGMEAGKPAAPASTAQPVAARPVSSGSEAQHYCQNIAAAAADAHFAWQAKQLKDLEAQLDQRIHELDAKETEYKQVLAQRDAAMKRADQSLVGIYAKMRPDAAAAQLSALDDDTAAAVLSQLSPRVSSAILNEVTPDRAVKLINAIAGPAPAEGKKS